MYKVKKEETLRKILSIWQEWMGNLLFKIKINVRNKEATKTKQRFSCLSAIKLSIYKKNQWTSELVAFQMFWWWLWYFIFWYCARKNIFFCSNVTSTFSLYNFRRYRRITPICTTITVQRMGVHRVFYNTELCLNHFHFIKKIVHHKKFQ